MEKEVKGNEEESTFSYNLIIFKSFDQKNIKQKINKLKVFL